MNDPRNKPLWEKAAEIGRSVADARSEPSDIIARLRAAPLWNGSDLHAVAADEIERLRAEVAALREDAERYRALRARRVSTVPVVSDPLRPDVTYTPDGLDAAIDDARKKLRMLLP